MVLNVITFANALKKLVDKAALTKDTATTYLSCIRVLSRMVDNTIEESIEVALREKKLTQMQMRKYINAIRKYEEIVLDKPEALLSNKKADLILQGCKKSTREEKELDEDHIKRKINGIHDERERLTLRLELKSGLRVSEISKLSEKDITFKDGNLIINVAEGKGRKHRIVKVKDDPYLYIKLQEYIENHKGEKLFLSRRAIKRDAAERGIETHDLRRLNARMRLNTEMEAGKTLKQAKGIVSKELGHSFTATTDIYLGRKARKNNE